ncbi:MAG: MerR family transcriptional regulator [Filimonas sp.]|nr:MerR family transcriptional regulator [Filimonas sp.]
MNVFTIRDLENLSGVKAHTIRIWEQRYAFLKPKRTGTNIRYYSQDELKTILGISLLNKYGFKISHIDKMAPVEIKERLLTLSQTEARQERIVNDLILYMVDLDTDGFEYTLGEYIQTYGTEKTILQVISPYLERIGLLWSANHINPAQQHLITNILRQKLISGIDSLPIPPQGGKSVLIFLPEGEHYELALLYVYYMLKRKGVRVLYIGMNAPLKDIEYVARLKAPGLLYTHLTTSGHNYTSDRFLHNLASHVTNIPLLITGANSRVYKKSPPENIHFASSFPEVYEFVASAQ